MDSLLLAGLSRLLHIFTPSHPPPAPTDQPQQTSPSTTLKSYESLLEAALSPSHPLHSRHTLPNKLLTTLLTPHSQLVYLSPGPLSTPSHAPNYVIDDVTRPPKRNEITAVLNGCVWDSRLVQAGFDWTAPSVWLVPLDVSLLAEDLLDRHFRMISTLSNSHSRILTLYPAKEVKICGFTLKPPFEDVEAFMKLCGFNVDSVTSLFDTAEKQSTESDEYMHAMHMAVVRPAPRALPLVMDTISEVTYMSSERSPQTASAEFEEYLSSDRRIIRFELDISTLPSQLAIQKNHIVLIGSESCVGCWDPRHAKRMTGRTDVPDVLVADIAISVFAADVEYKYAVVRGDDVVEWETGWNRRLTGDDKGIVRDGWRCS